MPPHLSHLFSETNRKVRISSTHIFKKDFVKALTPMCVDALFTCSSVQSRIKKEEARNITHSAYVGDKYHKEIFPAY